MIDDTIIENVIVNLPNFMGFVLGLVILYKANQALISQNNRLIDAIIRRENCDEFSDNGDASRAS